MLKKKEIQHYDTHIFDVKNTFNIYITCYCSIILNTAHEATMKPKLKRLNWDLTDFCIVSSEIFF